MCMLVCFPFAYRGTIKLLFFVFVLLLLFFFVVVVVVFMRWLKNN